MTIPAEAIDDLMALGAAALEAGDTVGARRAYRDVLERDPHHVPALLALAATVRTLRERRDLFLRVLTLDPAHQAAQRGLAETDALLSAGVLLDPALRTDVPVLATEPPPETIAAPRLQPPTIETCYRHPDRETGLHCIGCSQPICTQCAERTPVGMICPQCARQRLPTTYQVDARHVALAGLTAFLVGVGLTVAGALIAGAAGFFAFFAALLVGPIAGNLTARAVLFAAERKRGRTIMITVAAAYVFGALPVMLVLGFTLPLLLFSGVAVSSAVGALR